MSWLMLGPLLSIDLELEPASYNPGPTEGDSGQQLRRRGTEVKPRGCTVSEWLLKLGPGSVEGVSIGSTGFTVIFISTKGSKYFKA